MSRSRVSGTRRGRRRAMAVGVVLAVLLILVVAGTLRAEGGGDRVPDRVLIDDVDVSGLTPDEAERAVRFRARELRSRTVVVTSPDAPDLALTATRASLGARPRVQMAVEEAVKPYGIMGRVLAGVGLAPKRRVELRYTLDADRVDRLVGTVATDLNRPATDAGLILAAGDVRLTPGRAGFGLDPRVLRQRLATLPERVSIPLGPIAPAITTEEAQRAKTQAEAVLAGPTDVTFDGRGVPVEVATKRRAIRFVARDRDLLVRLDPDVIEKRLAPAFALRVQSARDARLEVNGESVKLVSSRRGRRLDAKAIALLMVRQPSAESVPVRFAVTEPAFTTQEARSLRITDRVSTFSTAYACCPPRVSNIQRAAEVLDGTIIPANATFSLNDALGERTEAKGYVEAPQIAAGKLEDSVGGGVSQVATTLYNAAFFAALEIVAHTPHSFYIPRYPVGREATVSWGGPELVFRNDWPAAVLIKATAGSNEVSISMYSAPLGRRVVTATGERRDFTEPQERVSENPDLEPGTRDVVQSAGGGGFTVSYTRQVYRGSDLKRDESFTWRYVPQDAFIEEGPPAPKEDEPKDDKPGAGDDPTGTDGAPTAPGGRPAPGGTPPAAPAPSDGRADPLPG